jgi:membrane peptidoglycan carboxypeptidase
VPLLGAQDLYNSGYKIYTTLDLNLEKKVEQIVYNNLYTVKCDTYLGCNGPLDQTNNINNAAAVVENPFNGEILAMDGSANYNDSRPRVSGRFNAALAQRQPGSAFKPIVYATAFEMGWYPAMILQDHQTIFPTPFSNNPPTYYEPQDYDGHFHTGFPMTVRNAIANSFNLPALDALEFTGIPNVLNTAGRLGLTEVFNRDPRTFGPSLALGTYEVSLLHLTGAYATFANRGVRVPPVYVLRITDELDRSLYTYDEAHPYGVQAIRPDVAFLMNSMLSDKTSRYHEFAPGNPLELDRPAAAKTGTTDSFRDNWTLGYTPYLAAGVWAGNSDNSVMQNVIGITGVGPIWHDIMEYASQYYHFPPDDFTRPSDIHARTVSALTGLLPHPGDPTVTDWFIDGTLPTIQ